MPHCVFSTFSVTRNRSQQNEDLGSTSFAASALFNQLFNFPTSSVQQLAMTMTTTRIGVLIVKLFSLSAFKSITPSLPTFSSLTLPSSSSPSVVHLIQAFALGCTVFLLLVPLQECQAMAVVPVVSKHPRSSNEVLMSSIRSQGDKINPKFQHSTVSGVQKEVPKLRSAPKGQPDTFRITDHPCFSQKNDSSCASQINCQWCKQWCIAEVPYARMTCDEISKQLPEVISVMPQVMIAGMPTLVMIKGKHLNTSDNLLTNVTFRVEGEGEGEDRSCTIIDSVNEFEIRCIIEGVDEKSGTLLYPKLNYNIILRGNVVPGDIDSNDTIKMVPDGDQQLGKPDEEGIDGGGGKDAEAWWKQLGELHTLHYFAGLLALFGLVAGVLSLATLRRRQLGAVWGLVERRLLAGSMRKTLLSRGLLTEYSSVTLKMKLGDGNFGEVYRAEVVSADGRQTSEVAIKKLRKGSSLAQVKQFLTEGIRMSGFEHERILRPVAITLDSTSPWMPAIVLPIMVNGDLCRYLRKSKVFPIVRLLTFAVQIAEGMEYLASENFVHGDLAARNCLLDEKYQLKIGDFGLCRQLQYRSDYVTINDIYRPVRWMAVECLTGGDGGGGKSGAGKNWVRHRQQPKFSLASDVWSFGVLLWEIFTLGSYPYEEFDNWSLVKAVAGGYRLHRPLNCPTAVYALMTSCWEVIPARRPSIGQLRERLAEMLAEVVSEMNGGAPSELAHSSVRSSGYTSLAERFVQSRRISAQSTTSSRSTLSTASSVSTTSSHLA